MSETIHHISALKSDWRDTYYGRNGQKRKLWTNMYQIMKLFEKNERQIAFKRYEQILQLWNESFSQCKPVCLVEFCLHRRLTGKFLLWFWLNFLGLDIFLRLPNFDAMAVPSMTWQILIALIDTWHITCTALLSTTRRPHLLLAESRSASRPHQKLEFHHQLMLLVFYLIF